MARKSVVTPEENARFEAKLPTFIPLVIVSPLASVRCPRCEGEFSIDGKRWRQPLMSVVNPAIELSGRACPYCMKVALIPVDFYPAKQRAAIRALRGGSTG